MATIWVCVHRIMFLWMRQSRMRRHLYGVRQLNHHHRTSRQLALFSPVQQFDHRVGYHIEIKRTAITSFFLGTDEPDIHRLLIV